MKNSIAKICFGVMIIIIIPIGLNFLLPMKLCTVIGGEKSSELWLNFLGNYIGIIVAIGIPLFVLHKNRKDQFNILSYQFEKTELDKNVDNMVAFLKIFMPNNIREIYNEWRLSGDSKICKLKIKELLDNVGLAFETFSTRYSNLLFQQKGSFFWQQSENYKQLVLLLQELQLIVELPNTIWNSPKTIGVYIAQNKSALHIISGEFMNILPQKKEGANILDILYECHPCVKFNLVENQIRNYILNQREILKNKYAEIANG